MAMHGLRQLGEQVSRACVDGALRTARHVSSRRSSFSTASRRCTGSGVDVGDDGVVGEQAAAEKQPAGPLTIQRIQARRRQAGKLVAGTAAHSDSDMFKSEQALAQAKARRWDHLLTAEAAARRPCVLKQAARHLKKPGLVSLGGGLPSAENFPFEAIGMQVASPDGDFAASAARHVTIGKYDVAERDAVFDLSTGLNYGQSVGSAQLLRFVTEHTELVHRPPYGDWRCALTIGATGSLEAAYRILCDGARGDSVLTEEYSFSTALETAAPLGIKMFGVKMDEQGLLASSMDEVLTGWDAGARGARKPTVLYTVPSGQNPTGATQSESRRRDIYHVCRKHDLIILEDDPYYFLQLQPYGGADAPDAPAVPGRPSVDDLLAGLVPSLVSLDVDGRVMRHDSFSKVVVPGARMGWVTASEQVIERYIRHAECSSQGPSGFSQVILHKLLDEQWGHDGYLKWLIKLRMEYSKRRNALLAACEHYLPRHLVSWTPPAAGMFLWLKVDHRQHPHAASRSLMEIEEDIFDSCIQKGVLVCRGSWFRAEQDKPPTGLFFRTTFAAASEKQMATAMDRFGAAVRQSFGVSR